MPDPGKCPHHDALQRDVAEIKATVTSIDKRLGSGDVSFGKIGIRLGIVEKVVYSGVALVLTGVGVALLSYVLKQA